jgi:hypothetical protein
MFSKLPGVEEILGFKTARETMKHDAPLHVKNVSRINIDAVAKLSTASPATRANFLKICGWPKKTIK